MEGNTKVDKLMQPILKVIERYVKDRDAVTDIYNRAYEALYISTDEITRLQSIIDDYRNDFKKVLNENCPTDEIHCGCVPILKKQLSNYQNALILITTFPSSQQQTFPEMQMQRVAYDTLNGEGSQRIDAVRYWVEKVDQLQSALEQERESHRWIPVSEKLPEYGIVCRVISKNYRFSTIAFLSESEQEWIPIQNNRFGKGEITHWMQYNPQEE